ncbi:hypothetical protein QCE47_20870 [Caballeronia sp. LZ025]|uniref:hypothetical protein n=1 Tax=Caballeronia TaxID=1827195 RepID=UPI001FD52564|nr:MULTISPECIES: hypothetical protein [Caballeronia]MDR5734768.1 hypothetical protein [Caballeronia sp. LZ025]
MSGANGALGADVYNGQGHRKERDERPGHENTAGNDVTDAHLNILPTAGGPMSKDAQPETFTVSGAGAFSTFDTSVTRPGSKYLNVDTDVSAEQFSVNLMSNGYKVNSQGTNKNGDFTVLSNGTSTYTIYTRSSTGEAGGQYFGPGGGSVKFNLKGN